MSKSAANRDHGSERGDKQAADFQSHVELLATLAKALHASGLPAHRLERMVTMTAERIQTPVHILAIPTGLLLSIGPEMSPVTLILRVNAGGVHLERLARLTAIARGIIRGQIEAPEAKRRIDFVMRAPPRWGQLMTVLGYVCSAGAFAVFFGGAMPEIGTSICVGLAVGLVAVVMQQFQTSTRLFELLAAAAAAAIAGVVTITTGHLVEWIPLASGLIILLPGLAMVDSLDELAHGHLASGGSRMAGVGIVLLAMAFGAVLGSLLVLPPDATIPDEGVPTGAQTWWVVPALVVVSFGSMVRFRARWRDYGVALAGSIVALAGARFRAQHLGSLAGPFLAALLLGTAANLFANAFRQPSQLLSVPGLALLVPGSFGVRSLSALLTEEIEFGVDIAFHMFLTAMALVGGLIISNSFFRERIHD